MYVIPYANNMQADRSAISSKVAALDAKDLGTRELSLPCHCKPALRIAVLSTQHWERNGNVEKQHSKGQRKFGLVLIEFCKHEVTVLVLTGHPHTRMGIHAPRITSNQSTQARTCFL